VKIAGAGDFALSPFASTWRSTAKYGAVLAEPTWTKAGRAKGARPGDEAIRPTGEELALFRRQRRLWAYQRPLGDGVIEQFSPDGKIPKE
jgi:hypothetical protein